MPYIIDNRAGQTVIIPDNALNQDFSIDLVGRNYENYGAIIAKSFVDLLDNFASSSAPQKQTDGQTWFDTTNNLLRVYDADQGLWVPIMPIISPTGAPSGENAIGSTYFDRQTGKFFVHDGSGFRPAITPGEINTGFSANGILGNPARLGTRLRNIFVIDTNGTPRPVQTLTYVNSAGSSPTFTSEEKIIALFSGHDEFTVDNVPYSSEGGSIDAYSQLAEANGIGLVIRPGLNLRADNNTRVERSNQAFRSDVAYTLNTGSYGADSANITASQVFFDSAHSVPTANATYNIGELAARLDKIYAQDFLVGNALLTLGDNVTVGTANDPVNTIFVTDIEVQGDIVTPNGGDLGEPTSPIDNGYFTNLFVTNELQVGTAGSNGYAFPVDDGTNQQQLFTDGAGQLQFADSLSNISGITGGAGLTAAYTTTTDPVTGLTTRDAKLDIVAGLGLTALEDELFVNDNEIDHNALANYDADEHVAHSSVTLSAGDGLTGGGDITQGRSFAVGAGTGITVNADDIAVDMSAFTTTNLAEGTNQYFTTARARASIEKLNSTAVGYGDVTYDQSTGKIGFTKVTDANIRGSLSGADGVDYTQSSGEFTLDVGYARVNVYSAGDGIQISPEGVISNTGVISIDTGNFVTTDGAQSIGGEKTFTTQQKFTSPVPINFEPTNNELDSQIEHKTSITFAGALGYARIHSGNLEAENDITAYYNFSDIRLKENLVPLKGSLDSVCKLTGYTYNYIDRPEQSVAGLIAQDVQEVPPEAVYETTRKTDDGDAYLGVRYEVLVPMLVEAIKELKAEVEELKKGK